MDIALFMPEKYQQPISDFIKNNFGFRPLFKCDEINTLRDNYDITDPPVIMFYYSHFLGEKNYQRMIKITGSFDARLIVLTSDFDLTHQNWADRLEKAIFYFFDPVRPLISVITIGLPIDKLLGLEGLIDEKLYIDGEQCYTTRSIKEGFIYRYELKSKEAKEELDVSKFIKTEVDGYLRLEPDKKLAKNDQTVVDSINKEDLQNVERITREFRQF